MWSACFNITRFREKWVSVGIEADNFFFDDVNLHLSLLKQILLFGTHIGNSGVMQHNILHGQNHLHIWFTS